MGFSEGDGSSSSGLYLVLVNHADSYDVKPDKTRSELPIKTL